MTTLLRRMARRCDPRVVLGLAVLISGCATTGLVNMWRDPEASGSIRSAYVVTTRRDPARRRIMEDAFTEALNERGIRAVASYREFPNDLPDTLEVAEAVRAGDFDAVLVVSPLGTRTVETWVPGYMTTRTFTGWNRWTGRYETFVREVEAPGYVDTDQVVRHQVDLWSTRRDGQLMWTATGNTVNPNSSRAVSKELVERVMNELGDQGIVPK